MEDQGLPDFSGKVVVLYVSNASRAIEDGIVLESPSFTKHGGRLFVVGRVPQLHDDRAGWAVNLEGGIAWESVNHYLVFDSCEEYIRRIRKVKSPLLRRLLNYRYQQ